MVSGMAIRTTSPGMVTISPPLRLNIAAMVKSKATSVIGPIAGRKRVSYHSLPFAFARKRSEEHTSELQSLMRISYAVFCLKKKKVTYTQLKYTNDYKTSQTPHTTPINHTNLRRSD